MKHLIAAFTLMLLFIGAAAAQCSDQDKKALEAFDRAWGQAGEKGDRAALMNLYADDYYGIPDRQGKKATIDATMAQFEADKANPGGVDKITHDHYMITCTAATALITHRNVISAALAPGGRPGTVYSRSMHTLEKRNGKWQVTSNAAHGMDDAMTIAYLEHDWNDAALSRNRDWFDKNYAADFVSVSSTSGTTTNKAGNIAGMMDGRSTIDWAETTNMSINVDGGRALVVGTYHSKGKDEKGIAYDRKIRFTDTWIRRDGRWLAWSTSGVAIP
jgi:ketosteroid isomerase-like protein